MFVTADSASEVAAFYKAKTGVTRTEMDGMYMFVLKKGANPYMPDHGFVIEPNKPLTAGPPKTAITFNRKKWRSPLMRKDESATRVHARRTDAD